MTVWLDAGHGGSDPGAFRETPRGRVTEAGITWPVTIATGAALEILGHEVCYTRHFRDTDVSIPTRTGRVNGRDGATAVISIHVNAHTTLEAQGREVWFLSQSGKGLATAILESMGRSPYLDAQKDRGAKYGPDYPDTNRRLSILRQTNPPAVLVEIGFISAAVDRTLIEHSRGQALIGAAIARGIANWLETRKLGESGICADCSGEVPAGEGCKACGTAFRGLAG